MDVEEVVVLVVVNMVVNSDLVFGVGFVVKSAFRGLVERTVFEVVGEIRNDFFVVEFSRENEHLIFKSKTFSITVCSGTKAVTSFLLRFLTIFQIFYY